jgi:hypothetical protein
MPIDTSMYNALLQRPKSVAEYDAEATANQTNALGLQQGRMKMDEYQRSVTDGNRLRQVVSGFGDDTSANTAMLLKAGRLPEAQAYQKSNAEVQAKTADIGKTKEETLKMQRESAGHQFEIAGQLASAWATSPGITKAQIQAGLAAASHSGVISPEITQAKMTELETMADNPQVLNNWAKGTLQQVMKAKDSMSYIAPDAGQILSAKTQVDTNAATNARVAAEGAANRSQQERASLRVDARAKEANNGADVGFTPDAITNAAARYNMDGTLPPMGMGKTGSAGRAAILNKAAELAAGVDPAQQRQDQILNKGDLATRNAAVRAFATGKDGQAIQSANTALNHLESIRNLAEAQKSGDVQAFNRAARAIGAQFGQAAPTNLNAALIMVAPEVSKAVIGAGGTGHERDQAIQALNPNGSPDQIIGATQTMQELFGGRLTEAKRTYERTTKKTDFDDALLSPAARKVIASAHSSNQGDATVPSDIAALLKKHGGK